MIHDRTLSLSGERLAAVYRLACRPEEVEARARAICVEQTVEFPEALIDDPAIRAQIIGEIASLAPLDGERFEVVIRYPVEVAGRELTQLINVLFGNVSLQPGVRLHRVRLPESLLRQYRGPRFGAPGLRDRVGVQGRPLLCTAIKPMGRSPEALAALAYRLALGGIDLIKDDHGLADHAFCPFAERVARCAEAVARANRETGGRSLYLPNVTAPADEIVGRARQAKAVGAGGLLVCPGLVGLDALRALADDDALALPILSHPAFQGAYCVNPDAGLSHGVLFGQLNRLAGADAAIFPHWGGRFAFTQAECRDLVDGATCAMGAIRPILPVPAGGLRLERVEELGDFYGRDCILLIGGDLHAQGPDLVATCRRFVARAEAAAGP
ncbi:RuBisCO large subunit C-terminal-like domain-containing protein [Thiococcus pfennigii]|uniref:RuBisCO large subunit C-terminal-like domain-containing protein n=1 Tax=Thiococcus pfennigii TaxID=1057 RepID=UPI00190560DE|nr:RuBisCO large subunit C-terminal-like domain-containing protein [Thiococcus pfennigii]MBK1700095.1 ribulose 1,5-bisphosphate carboxylase large subunit [Thiococcus pfennigii]MBK1732987.1 ribulose 1,5-bisphosphate carboxylase large subunit [Thiococcus pfennigii]